MNVEGIELPTSLFELLFPDTRARSTPVRENRPACPLTDTRSALAYISKLRFQNLLQSCLPRRRGAGRGCPGRATGAKVGTRPHTRLGLPQPGG